MVQTESTDGVTVVFDEPTVVFPKRTVLLKNFAPEFLDLKEKDAEDGIKEDALPTGMYSSVQSLDVAEPVGKISPMLLFFLFLCFYAKRCGNCAVFYVLMAKLHSF